MLSYLSAPPLIKVELFQSTTRSLMTAPFLEADYLPVDDTWHKNRFGQQVAKVLKRVAPAYASFPVGSVEFRHAEAVFGVLNGLLNRFEAVDFWSLEFESMETELKQCQIYAQALPRDLGNGLTIRFNRQWELRHNNGLVGRFRRKKSAERAARKIKSLLSCRGRLWRTQAALAVVKRFGGEVR